MGFTLQELSDLFSIKLIGDPNHIVFGINTLEDATKSDVSFFANPKYEEAMRASNAGVICIGELAGGLPHFFQNIEKKNFFICKDPSKTFQEILEFFLTSNESITGFSGIHPTALIHETATIGKNVSIGPNSVIDANVEIDENTKISSLVYIGAKTKIGKDCFIHPNVTIRENTIIKNRVIIQPGAVIGSCGFGYVTNNRGEFKKLNQLGCVVLEDDVEIGANTTIDRARFKETIIRSGTKIDNLVQIAHNVDVGQHNAIAAQTGIAGSSKTGSHVLMGGQVGITGHVEIGDNVIITTRSGVSKNISKAGKYRGSPAIDFEEHNRQQVYIRKLKFYIKKIEDLEKELKSLASN